MWESFPLNCPPACVGEHLDGLPGVRLGRPPRRVGPRPALPVAQRHEDPGRGGALQRGRGAPGKAPEQFPILLDLKCTGIG